MFMSRRFLAALGIAGISITALFKICSERLSSREKAQLKTALNQWENEGGNPLPVTPPINGLQ